MMFVADIPSPAASKVNSLSRVIEFVTMDKYDSRQEEIYTYLLPVDFEVNTLENLESFILRLADLKKNWDGRGALSITPKVISNTFQFIKRIPTYYTNFLTEDSFTPTPYGTLVIDWYSEDEQSNLSIEIGETEIGFFVKKNDEYLLLSEGLKFNEYDIPNQIVEAFKQFAS